MSTEPAVSHFTPSRSAEIGELAKALAAAQGEIRAAEKDRENPFFKSSYATLASVWDAIRGPLSKHGLAIVQSPQLRADGSLVLETELMHSSGQWLASVYPIKPVKPDPQGYGSAITYARRYQLAAMVGVAAEEDDDGNADPPPPPAEPLANEAQEKKAATLRAALDAAETEDQRKAIIAMVSKEPKAVRDAVREANFAARARIAAKPAGNEVVVS
jgi:hypothetical protein